MEGVKMFWGHKIMPGKRYDQVVEAAFHVSKVCLDPTSAGSGVTSVYIETGGDEFIIANLSSKTLDQALDLNFTEGEKIAFRSFGPGCPHLTGYILPEERDQFDEDDFQSSDEDAEEEEVTPQLVALKAAKKKVDEKASPLDKLVSEQKKKGKMAKGPQNDEEVIAAIKKAKEMQGKVAMTAKKRQEGSDDDSDDDDDESDDSDDYEDMEFEDGEAEEADSDDDEDDDDDEDQDDEDDDDDDDDDEENDLDDEEMAKILKKMSNGKPAANGVTNGKEKSPTKKDKTPKKQEKSPTKKDKTPKKQEKSPTKKDKTPMKQEEQKIKTPGKQEKEKTPNKKGKTPKKDEANKTPGKNEGKATPAKTPGKNEGKATPAKTPGKNEGKATPAKTPKKTIKGGIVVEDLQVGTGPDVKRGKRIGMYYEGKLKSNNKKFDACLSGKPFQFRLGQGEVIKGWDIGLEGMKVGGKRRLVLPPNMAYGHNGAPPSIPPNSTLVFDVECKFVN